MVLDSAKFNRSSLTKSLAVKQIVRRQVTAPATAPAYHNPHQSFQFSETSVRQCLPSQLKPKPPVSELGFGTQFTDHMLRVEYDVDKGGWQSPLIVPLEPLTLHPAAKGLHYALQLFEGMKAYRGVDGRIRVFRPDLNMARMNNSALRISLPQFDGEELLKCIKKLVSLDREWVPISETASLYIRPTLVATDPVLGVNAPSSALLYVILSPVGPYFQTMKALTLLAEPNYVRAWPGGSGSTKVGANYGPTIYVQSVAKEVGAHQILWLFGENHAVTEAGAMNVFCVFINDKGRIELSTPPLNGLILPGVTRASILDLAREWNEFDVSERFLTMSDIVKLRSENRLLEFFGSGTAVLVNPVERLIYNNQVIDIPTMDQPDPIFLRLLRTLTDIQYGRLKHPWAEEID
ncbi:branched-chain-amino-acid aminotransferase, cytosolic isoform X1 [Bemisia tabaci]|uniref:branched-chain-amino-acid aminotransferase, cytosolic isoform X1 n=1 Tax=Bemisia tabaci TaxID=7038 RepID=UPI003B281B4C